MSEQAHSLEYTAEYLRTILQLEENEVEGMPRWLAALYERMEAGDLAGCQYLIRMIKGMDLSPHSLGLFLLGTGDFYAQIEDWPAAEKAYQQAISHFEMSDELDDQAIALNNLALILQEQGRYEEANARYAQVAQIYTSTNNWVGLGHTLSNLGSVADQRGDWESAIAYYQQSIAALEKTETKHDLASVVSNLGVAYESLGRWPEAETSYMRCVDILDELEEAFSEHGIRVLMNLGQLYGKQGDGEKAVQVYHQALQISQTLEEEQLEFSIWNNLGTVHTRMNQHQEAADCFQHSLELAQKLGDRQQEALALSNAGSSFHDLGQIELAVLCFENSLALSEELDDQYGMARASNNLGVLYEDLKQFEKALEYYENSAAILSAIGDAYRAITTYINIGTLLGKRGRLAEANRVVEQTWRLAENNRYFDQLMTLSILQGDIAFQQPSTELDAYRCYARACQFATQHSRQAVDHVVGIIRLQLTTMEQHQQFDQAKAFVQVLLATWKEDRNLWELHPDALQQFISWIGDN